MKTFNLTLITAFITLNLFAQPDYEKAIQQSLSALREAQTPDELAKVSNKFERIAEAEPNKWLPSYYAGYTKTIMAFQTQEPAKKGKLTEAAQLHCDKALKIAPEESELYTLQGMIYQAIIGIDPMANGQIYSGKAAGAFQTALKYNSNNPRPHYMQGLSVMHTPEQYGGGKKAAYPIFAEATKLFNKFEPSSLIAPNWGKEDCLKQLEICKPE